MEKNTLLAVVISMVILVGWSYFFPPPEPPKPETPPSAEVTQALDEVAAEALAGREASMASEPADTLPETPVVAVDASLPAREIVVQTDRFRVLLNSRGGVATSLQLTNYDHTKPRLTLSTWFPILEGVLGPDYQLSVTEGNKVEMLSNYVPNVEAFGVQFEDDSELTQRFRNASYAISVNGQTLEPGTDQQTFALGAEDESMTVELRSVEVGGVQLVKTLTFRQGAHLIDYDLQVINRSLSAKPLKVRQLFGEARFHEGEVDTRAGHRGPVYFTDGSLETHGLDEARDGLRVGDFDWVGLEDHYFISAAAPLAPVKEGFYQARETEGTGLAPYYGIRLPLVELLPGKLVEVPFQLYFGPKDEAEMTKFGRNLNQSLNMTLESLAGPLLSLLRGIYGVVGNYGVAIIILTVIVRLVLFPLTYRGMKSMKRMQQLAPKMKRIQEKYKNDKEKLQMEMMGLYRKNKVNPVGGCLPLLLQIPVFLALYSALSSAVELRHAPFGLWLSDLSQADGLGITPILMGATLYFQQKLTPQSAVMDPTQAKIMQLMPLVFAVFSFTFPSGLVLYWVTSNLLSMGQQQIINRIKTPEIQD